MRMPLRFQIVASTFQPKMDVALSTVTWQFGLVYLADIIVFFCSAVEHIEYAKHVMGLVRDAGVILEQKNCKFLTESIDYLGHSTCPGRLVTASHTADATKGLKALRIVTESHSYLRLNNVFRGPIPDCSKLPSPLNDKLQK